MGAEWLFEKIILNSSMGQILSQWRIAGRGSRRRKGQALCFIAVQAAEKVYQSYSLEVKGTGRPQARKPTKDNTIYRLAESVAAATQNTNFPMKLSEITQRLLHQNVRYSRPDRLRQT